MRNLPTAPARTPEPNRIDSVSPTGDGRSAYWGLDAQGTVAAYLKRLRSISVQLIVVLLANLVVMLWAVRLERYVLYLVALALTLVAAFVTRLRKVKLFTGLSEVVSQDCDPARYRAVLDVLSARDRFGRSANTIAIELAYCDYLELDSAGALRRLESVTFKRKDNVRWFRAMQIEFLSRVDAGNLEGARAWPWPTAISSARTGSSISPSTSCCTGRPGRRRAWRPMPLSSHSRRGWSACAPRSCQGWR